MKYTKKWNYQHDKHLAFLLQLKMPDDYRQWFIMMVTEFGTRFTKLFRGPGWSGCESKDFNYPIKVQRPLNNMFCSYNI